MRRILVLLALLITSCNLMAQTTGYVPFTYANKTIEELEKRPVLIDSLKRVYKKRWTIGLEYGLRFVSNSGRSTLPDTITLADFTSKRSFIGLEGGYFVSKDIQVFLAFDFMSLPKNQTITSLTIGGPNGIQVEGSGSGGAMVNVGIGGKYFFNVGAFSRIYTGLKLGIIKAVAEGGNGGFTLAQGQYQQTIRQSRNYNYGNILFGLAHRLSPRLMIDINMGYLHASSSRNIGGIISPGGITSTLALQFIIGKWNRVR
ncbi:hypothetical protein [Aquiflexum gelatinilyticum]|uniref:Outer membrane protein beta-barrel domain-containing protein n=1 Tax=Aquiflexum gelatinilyticum TaxID=2961943 RepID=A0A9X2P1R5_9BACT|nr:hypothetical protein [Aquiflexum gelatinilyticum]MCR9013598.1 hypothetical protein [Aquiflexum gelatinilyticum]